MMVFNAGQPRVDEETFADGQAVWSRHPDAGVKLAGWRCRPFGPDTP